MKYLRGMRNGKEEERVSSKRAEPSVKTRQRAAAGTAAQSAEFLPGMNKSLDLIPSAK